MLIVKGQTMTQHSVASYSFTYRPCQLYHIVLPRSLAAFLLCREVGAKLHNCGALIRGAHLHLGITLPSWVWSRQEVCSTGADAPCIKLMGETCP